jgi:phage tail protein X
VPEKPPEAAVVDSRAAPVVPEMDSSRLVNAPIGRRPGGPLPPAPSVDAPDPVSRVAPIETAEIAGDRDSRGIPPRAVRGQIERAKGEAASMSGSDRADARGAGVREIRVRSGRGLRAMARDVYGDDSPRVIAQIKKANPQITDVNHIRVGDLLRFPDLTEAD